MHKPKIYFPNLNGIRFIAALLVIIHHIEQLKSLLSIDSYWESVPFVHVIGKLGVVLFFVLSGFLITYLLLTEEDTFKTISIKQFYIRRVLRIWPLYFLIIILAFFILPNISLLTLPGFGKDVIYTHLALKILLYAIFFPNLVLALLGVVPYASHTWSIGTEEQFYLVWPVVLKFFKRQRILLMFFIICVYLGLYTYLNTSASGALPYKNVLSTFLSTFNIDCMAIGGTYALVLFQKNRILPYLLNNYLFYFSVILTGVFIGLGVEIPYIHNEFYATFFGIIILNLAVNKQFKVSLENNVLNYLGNISYGLYMYHPIAIVLILALLNKVNLVNNWLTYPLSIILTIVIAATSYRYYETWFLKFKHKFSKVLSGNAVAK